MMVTKKFVIPGRAEGANPESRTKLGACVWIPGSRAARVPRNDY
jgi:hypothetical protein